MKVKVSITLDGELVAAIERVAAMLGAKRSSLIERLVREGAGEFTGELPGGATLPDLFQYVADNPSTGGGKRGKGK